MLAPMLAPILFPAWREKRGLRHAPAAAPNGGRGVRGPVAANRAGVRGEVSIFACRGE